jgi:hypothetical protein
MVEATGIEPCLFYYKKRNLEDTFPKHTENTQIFSEIASSHPYFETPPLH